MLIVTSALCKLSWHFVIYNTSLIIVCRDPQLQHLVLHLDRVYLVADCWAVYHRFNVKQIAFRSCLVMTASLMMLHNMSYRAVYKARERPKLWNHFVFTTPVLWLGCLGFLIVTVLFTDIRLLHLYIWEIFGAENINRQLFDWVNAFYFRTIHLPLLGPSSGWRARGWRVDYIPQHIVR